jgi:capsular polysaccharide transport system permease protein
MYWLIQHARVTAALIIRETASRYGSKPGGYVWAIIDPLAHVYMMTIIFGAIARVPALGTDFALFFATGYLPFLAYQGMSSFIAGAVKANKNLFSYPVVAPIDAVVARYILQLLTSALVTIMIFAFCTPEANHLNSIDPGTVVAAFESGTLLGLGVGLFNIPMFDNYPLYEQIFSLINRPMFLLSGVFFLPDSLPHPFQDVLLWNPIVHIIMWFRSGIYPEYEPPGLDIGYVAMVTAAICVSGFALFTTTRSLRADKY